MGERFAKAKQSAMRILTWLILLVGLAAVLGCGAEKATPTPTKAAAPGVTATPTKAPPPGVTATPTPSPTPAVLAVPASVAKLTIAFGDWGGDVINPWQYVGTGLLQDYLNLRLFTRDENRTFQPLWATEWQQTEQGITYTFNPIARCQNGEPADARLFKANVEGWMGLNPKFKGSTQISYLKSVVDSVEVIDDYKAFVKTKSPDAGLHSLWGGHNYHQLWSGPAKYLNEVGHDAYVANPIGCGMYKMKEFHAKDRIVWERWEEFWGDYPYWKKPQHRIMEWIQVPDAAARFAQLASRQADVVIDVPYAVAKDLRRSPEPKQDVNPKPGSGDLWVQILKANGKMQIVFPVPHIIQEKLSGWEELVNDPSNNIKVREALELAIDKRAIVKNFHYGFTSLSQSIYSMESFGWRREQGESIPPYDPKRAKELLAEAGYPSGFTTTVHFGVFAGRPGQREALEAVASYWKDIGITLNVREQQPTEFYTRVNRPDRAYRPLTEETWGRQEFGPYLVVQCCTKVGIRATYNDKTDELGRQIQSTLDEKEQLRLMKEIEDEVLRNRWVIPLFDASAVNGYTDRVLAHPMPEYGAHYLDLNRVVLRD